MFRLVAGHINVEPQLSLKALTAIIYQLCFCASALLFCLCCLLVQPTYRLYRELPDKRGDSPRGVRLDVRVYGIIAIGLWSALNMVVFN